MSGRFFGTWPEGHRTVIIEEPVHTFPDSHKMALTRAGLKLGGQKGPSPLEGKTKIGARSKSLGARATSVQAKPKPKPRPRPKPKPGY